MRGVASLGVPLALAAAATLGGLPWPGPAPVSAGPGPLVLSAGFEVASRNVCPTWTAEEHSGLAGGFTVFGLGGSWEVHRRYQRLDCSFPPEALRAAALAGVRSASLESVPAAREEALLREAWVRAGRPATSTQAAAAGRSAGADLVLTGSMTDLGTAVMVAVQVLDVASGTLSGAVVEAVGRPEDLPSRVAALVRGALGQAREARPLAFVLAGHVRAAADRLAGRLLAALNAEVVAEVVRVLPSGSTALLRVSRVGAEPEGAVHFEGGATGRVVRRAAGELVVSVNDGRRAGRSATLPVVPRAVRWRVLVPDGGTVGEALREWSRGQPIPTDGCEAVLSLDVASSRPRLVAGVPAGVCGPAFTHSEEISP